MIPTKKIFLTILTLAGLCSCNLKQETQELEKKQETIKDNEDKEFVEPYLDENPISLGLYLNNNNTRYLVTTFSSPLTIYQDIISLEVFYTKESTLTGDQKTLWNQYYSNDTDITSYKIGYHISFKTTDQEINQTILKPTDTDSIFEYIQIYLYDDINQTTGWYDHITQEEVTDGTIFTSIKLTASTKIDSITSPITVTTFTYDEDDFDIRGNYRGNSCYQVTINRE